MNSNMQPLLVLLKWKSPRWEPNQKTLDWHIRCKIKCYCYTGLPWQCRLSDKPSILFKPRHARRFHSHFLYYKEQAMASKATQTY